VRKVCCQMTRERGAEGGGIGFDDLETLQN
jgi:hypothetical protein